jgi:hypothetical protein
MRGGLMEALAGLGRNLLAGLRLATFRPVERNAFRVDLVAWLLLIAFSALLDMGLDWVRASTDAQFALTGLDGELYAVGLLMVTVAVVAAACRDATLFVVLPVVVLASFPLLQVVHAAPDALDVDMPERVSLGFDVVMLAWMVAVASRCVHLATTSGPRWKLRAILGGLLITAPLWFGPLLGPDTPWFEEPSGDDTDTTSASATGPGTALDPASEAVMAAQAYVLDQALDDLEDERGGVTDLYFAGFAPDARKGGFRTEVETLQATLDERFGTGGRSLVMVNSRDTLTQRPFATVTNLRRVLNEMGEAIDPDDDVVMLYLTAADTDEHGLAAEHPPLDLLPLTPQGLKQLLDAAEIRYRVIVVSTCAAGAWVDALADDDSLVLVSSPDGTRVSGCEGAAAPSPFATRLRAALEGNDGLGDALRRLAAETHAQIAVGAHIDRQLERIGREAGVQSVLLRRAARRGEPALTRHADLRYNRRLHRGVEQSGSSSGS